MSFDAPTPDEEDGIPPSLREKELSTEGVREQATTGIGALAMRSVAILGIGLLGGTILARLLTPNDFGIVAVGLSFITFVGLLADGDLGGGLIRRKAPPTMAELRALTGLQLSITVAFTLVVAAIGTQFGQAGAITTVMVATMPITILQFPARIMLERTLRFPVIARVEVLQVLAYNVTAIGLVLLGFGVWGMALGTVVRAVVGAVAMVTVSPVGMPLPSFRIRVIRPLMKFGLQFQAVSASTLARDQGLNAGIAVVAGTATLGLVTLARRLMEVPYLLLRTLGRVSYPAMARLLEQNQDPAPLIRRALEYSSIGVGFVVVGLVGSAPGLIPGVFGEQWQQASYVLPGACLGLAIGGSVSVATQGYLYAMGDAKGVLRASVLATTVTFGVTLSLLSVMGVEAVGFGLLAAGIVESFLLVTTTKRTTAVKFIPLLSWPTLTAVVAATVGWTVSVEGGETWQSGILGGLVATGLYVGILFLTNRDVLLRTLAFSGSALRQSLKRA